LAKAGDPASATGQWPEENYRLVYAAAILRLPIAALFDGKPRLLGPDALGYNHSAGGECSVISAEEKPGADHCRLQVRESGGVYR
jgi:hypothetical protein